MIDVVRTRYAEHVAFLRLFSETAEALEAADEKIAEVERLALLRSCTPYVLLTYSLFTPYLLLIYSLFTPYVLLMCSLCAPYVRLTFSVCTPRVIPAVQTLCNLQVERLAFDLEHAGPAPRKGSSGKRERQKSWFKKSGDSAFEKHDKCSLCEVMTMMDARTAACAARAAGAAGAVRAVRAARAARADVPSLFLSLRTVSPPPSAAITAESAAKAFATAAFSVPSAGLVLCWASRRKVFRRRERWRKKPQSASRYRSISTLLKDSC